MTVKRPAYTVVAEGRDDLSIVVSEATVEQEDLFGAVQRRMRTEWEQKVKDDPDWDEDEREAENGGRFRFAILKAAKVSSIGLPEPLTYAAYRAARLPGGFVMEAVAKALALNPHWLAGNAKGVSAELGEV